MDSLTQIVLGAAVGEATLGKKVGNKALLYGAIAGTIPDLDVVFGKFTDTITAIEWHRGFSHSILFCLVFAPVFGWLTNKIDRKLNLGWKPWTNLFFWGLFTHPLLDAFTTWGTQLFWPFNYRIAFNSIFVIDPFYTLPLLIFCIVILFKKKGSKGRIKLNKISLMISSFYLLLTLIVKYNVNNKFENALKENNISYKKISTRPAPLNILLWNANVETESNYLLADYSFFDTKPIGFKAFPKQRKQSEAIEAYPNVKRLIDISNGWYIIEKEGDRWVFNDLRFGLIPQKNKDVKFAFSYELKLENNQIIAHEVPKKRDDIGFMFKNLIERIKGN